MTYSFPTSADLKARFTDFSAVADNVIERALEDAQSAVSQAWNTQQDYTLGALYYAAHILTRSGHGSSKEAQIYASGLGNVTNIVDGGVSITRSAAATSGSDTLESTTFGQDYVTIRRRNVIGIAVMR